jgi:hypothetical protein
MSSWHTFSREATLREVRVMRILWIFYIYIMISWRDTTDKLEEKNKNSSARDGTYGTLAHILLWLLE